MSVRLSAQSPIPEKIKYEIEPASTNESTTRAVPREIQDESELPFRGENTLSEAARKSLLEGRLNLLTNKPAPIPLGLKREMATCGSS